MARSVLTLSDKLALPTDAVTQTFAILAMRGVGKTHTASVLAEEFCEVRLPFVVLDPTGAWWGLRASRSGKGEGYPVTILGGDHGDAPLEETAGKVVADMAVEEATPLVLDMSRFSKGAMARFVADFAERLYMQSRDPLHLIVDEADAFAPQKPRPEEHRMLGALDQIVRRGRIRGLGCTLVTQRSAVLNKDVLTQTEVLVAMRTAHPRDRAPVLEWMKVHATEKQLAAVEASLASLPKGDAWVMSAGWLDLFKRVHFRERRTFNSSATPKPGERRVVPKSFARIDPAVLKKRLSQAIERAKASDPAALRQKVAELERQVAIASRTKPQAAPEAKAKVVEKRVITPADKDRMVKAIERAERLHDRMAQAAQVLVSEIGNLTTTLQGAVRQQVLSGAVHPAKPERMLPPPPKEALRPMMRYVREKLNEAKEVGEVSKGEKVILTAIAQYEDLGEVTKEQLTALTGYKVSSRNTYLAKLQAAGLVSVNGSRVATTDTGRAYFVRNNLPRLPSGAGLLEHWLHRLPTGEKKILEVLVSHHPEMVRKEDLDVEAGYKVSSRNTYLAKLSSRRLVVVERDMVGASKLLFD